MHSLEPQITFYVKCICMWFFALVIFPLKITNSDHHGNLDDSFTWDFTLKSLPIKSWSLLIPQKYYKSPPNSLPITHIHYQSSHFHYQSPQSHYQSPTFIINHPISITNHSPMDYQSTYFLVIAEPPVEYKRGPIFWLPEKNTVPVY